METHRRSPRQNFGIKKRETPQAYAREVSLNYQVITGPGLNHGRPLRRMWGKIIIIVISITKSGGGKIICPANRGFLHV
jgi:hypothetical protein